MLLGIIGDYSFQCKAYTHQLILILSNKTTFSPNKQMNIIITIKLKKTYRNSSSNLYLKIYRTL